MKKIGEGMIRFVEEKKKNFDRDGRNTTESDVIVLIGLKEDRSLGLNCGACG